MRDPTIVQSPVAMKRITVAYGAIRECAMHQKCGFAQCYAMYGGTTSASDVTAIRTPIRRVSAPSARTPDAAPPRGLPRRSSRGSYLAGTITSRSLPDSAPQASPARPSICRTSALRRSEGKLSNFSVTGSNLTIALIDQSVSQTLSRSSTHTEYAWALPGNFHSRQDLLAGSYMPTCPVFQ